jgi:TRAP-type uncharacterized transport system fused permease subunit
MIGDWPWIVWRVIVSCIGIAMLASGLHGYLLGWMPGWQRAIAIVAAFSLVVPYLASDILGIGLAAALIAYQYFVPSAVRPAPLHADAAEHSQKPSV